MLNIIFDFFYKRADKKQWTGEVHIYGLLGDSEHERKQFQDQTNFERHVECLRGSSSSCPTQIVSALIFWQSGGQKTTRTKLASIEVSIHVWTEKRIYWIDADARDHLRLPITWNEFWAHHYQTRKSEAHNIFRSDKKRLKRASIQLESIFKSCGGSLHLCWELISKKSLLVYVWAKVHWQDINGISWFLSIFF